MIKSQIIHTITLMVSFSKTSLHLNRVTFCWCVFIVFVLFDFLRLTFRLIFFLFCFGICLKFNVIF